MPVVCHGRSPKQPGGPTGSYVFRTWKKSGWSDSYPERREEADGDGVDLREVPQLPGAVEAARAAGAGLRLLGLPAAVAGWVFATYRLRFGIETSYRQMHEGRIRTTTRRPAVRLLYVGIALVLRNLWVWLHYTSCRCRAEAAG